jgi:hypothetical protein
MKPIPPMLAAIFLTLVAALIACHLALISDLLMVTIVLALLVVLIANELDSSECDQLRTKSPSVLTTASPDKFPAAARIFAASRRRTLSWSRRNAFPAPADPFRRNLAAAGSRPVCLAEAVRRAGGHWPTRWPTSDLSINESDRNAGILSTYCS